MKYEFERVAIVNRGEAAMRFIHAAREFNQEHGTSLRTIALFTECERHAMFVREADEAVCLGATRVFDANTQQCKSSYVDYACLQRALAAARAEAVWVGWGFVAEQAAFADLCQEMDLVFIGPDGDIMRRVGDKIASKLLAEQASVPVAPWSGGPVETMAEASRHAGRLGYPLLIKATAGGGGHGIRKVFSESQLRDAFESARSEAFKAFGDPTVFLEKLLTGVRHVEVQIIADNFGTTWAAGVRDCTIQRRHQKILEEAPSPALSPAQDLELRNAAVRLSQFAGYRNAGTVEFLYQPETQVLSFMEINTRLQVEHPVTECTTGLDLVKLQIHVARGGRLLGDPPRTTGVAIEVRLNAEDPDNAFAPSPGLIERFKIPTGPGIRIDTGVAEGDVVPAEFDSMMAKLIAHGRDRKEAISRLQRALRDSVVVIKDGCSNKSFLQGLLSRDEVQQADFHVGWLDRLAASGEHLSREYGDVALVHAAIETYQAQAAVEQAQFYASAVRGRPQIHCELGRTAELRYRGQIYSPRIVRTGAETYCVEVDGARIQAQLERLGHFEYWLTVFGRRFHIVSAVQGSSYRIEVDGVSHKIDRDDGGVVHAPSPSVVVSIAVKPGDSVAAGDRLLVLEAMKMEMQVLAPFCGKIRHVMTMRNVQVDAGAPLVQIDPSGDDLCASAAERIIFRASSEEQQQALSDGRRSLEQLRQLMLGFDVDPKESARIVSEWKKSQTADAPEMRILEEQLLDIFVDFSSLFRRDPELNPVASGEEPSAEAYLFSYLRMLEAGGEGLPPLFVKALRRALSHYGVNSLEESPQLKESLLWIYKSHQRIDSQISPVLAVLENRLHAADALNWQPGNSFRDLLDRLIAVSNGQFLAISDLAREVRYRCFDQPLLEKARKQVYDKVEEQLAYLGAILTSMTAMNECVTSSNVLSRLRLCFAVAAPQLLSRCRNSCLRPSLGGITAFVPCAISGHSKTREIATPQPSMSTTAGTSMSSPLILNMRSCCNPPRRSRIASIQIPLDHDVVLDFYAWKPDPATDPDITQQQVSALLNQCDFGRPLRRVILEIASASPSQSVGGMQHFTYRCGAGGYEEEKLYRGIHPMMAKRLHLWRLSNFNIERLPSIEDVYLLRAMAKENPKDERLIAVAEVRDVTPRRDESGRVVALPHLERMLSEAIAAIRMFQAHRASESAPLLEPHISSTFGSHSHLSAKNFVKWCAAWRLQSKDWVSNRSSFAPASPVELLASCAI